MLSLKKVNAFTISVYTSLTYLALHLHSLKNVWENIKDKWATAQMGYCTLLTLHNL